MLAINKVADLPFKKIDFVKLHKRNGEKNLSIIFTVLKEVVKKFPSVKWSKFKLLAMTDLGEGAYFSADNNQLNFNVGHHEFHLADLRFLVYHEIGHLLDSENGLLVQGAEVSEYNNISFSQTFVMDMIAEMSTYCENGWVDTKPEETRALWRMYGSIPSEIAANRFAAKRCRARPVDMGLGVFYDLGVGDLPLYEFD